MALSPACCTSCTAGVFWVETEGRGKIGEEEEFSSSVCEASVCEHIPATGCFVLKGFFYGFGVDWVSFKRNFFFFSLNLHLIYLSLTTFFFFFNVSFLVLFSGLN